jgi:hypothetical protein
VLIANVVAPSSDVFFGKRGRYQMNFFGFLLSLLCSTSAIAHSGRTDVSGCHTNRQTGEYHCHNAGFLTFNRETKTTGQPSARSGSFQSECPVVGNTESKIYHVPGGLYYERMLVRNSGGDNRRCFGNESEAESAGFRASKR